MRIAQVVPPWIATPPKGYGGVERVVSQLTEALVRHGHDVTLFASGDSQTSARLSSYYPQAIGNDGTKKKNPFTMLLHTFPAFRDAHQFDVIHCHDVYQSLFFSDLVKTPVVHTMHGATMKNEQPADRREIYEQFPHLSYVSISNAQREGLSQLHYVGTVYNGIDISEFSLGTGDGKYLAWMGRVTPKKGIVEAIHIAKRTHYPLHIAATIDPVDQEFFDTEVKPLIDGTAIQFLGELKDHERGLFLQRAKALLYPIRWHEPFGLVMVESLASGTPVVACDLGSVSELLIDGQTGYIVAGSTLQNPYDHNAWTLDMSIVTKMEESVNKIFQKSPAEYQQFRVACRQRAVENFSIEKMTHGYETIYRSLTGLSI